MHTRVARPVQQKPLEFVCPQYPCLHNFGHLVRLLRRTCKVVSAHNGMKNKIHIVTEFLRFLRMRKKYWLMPIVGLLLLLSLLIVLTQGSALAPFIYSLF